MVDYGGVKPGMVSRMGALLVESPWMFLSKRLLGECRTFVSMAGGRTGAASGAHDDCLMAMAVAQAVRAELLGGRMMRGLRVRPLQVPVGHSDVGEVGCTRDLRSRIEACNGRG